MNKKYSTSILLLCFWLFNAEAMENDPRVLATGAKKVNLALTPAADGKDRFSTLPTDLIPQIIMPYGEDKELTYNVNPRKYIDIAVLNKSCYHAINSLNFVKAISKKGIFFNIVPTAKNYHRVNQSIIASLQPLLSSINKKKLKSFKNAMTSLKTDNQVCTYFDPNYIDHATYCGAHSMLTLGICTDSFQTVQLLLAHKANPNFAIPKSGFFVQHAGGLFVQRDRYPLLVACGEHFPRSSNTSETVAICELLLDAKADPNIAGCNNNALHHLINGITASRLYNPGFDEPAAQLVSRLIDAKVDVNHNQLTENDHISPIAKLYRSVDILSLGHSDYTPYLKVAAALVEGGLNTHSYLGFGRTAADLIRCYVAAAPDSVEKINLLRKI